jgi:hypothetical protein
LSPSAAKNRGEDAFMVSSCCESFGHTAAVSFGLPVVGFADRPGTGSHLGTR